MANNNGYFFFFFDKEKKQEIAKYASVSEAIRDIVQSMMDKVMDKVLVSDPFIPEVHHSNKPLYAALVPDEIFKDAHFERRFVKQKIFKLLAMNGHPVDMAYFALPYNPYGKREYYNWPFAERWFNMKEDPSVLIGEELWNLIGGEGTYAHFIDEINKLGIHYKERIYREFLGIEPPENFDKNKLR